MDRTYSRKQIRLTVYDNEPLARLAQQRLQQERIPCVLRPLGAGWGGWGVATYLPHALYVKVADEMRARQVLDLPPGEIAERDGPATRASRPPNILLIAVLIVVAAAFLLGSVELAGAWFAG